MCPRAYCTMLADAAGLSSARAQRTLQASRSGEEVWGIRSLDLKASSFEDIPALT